MLTILVDLCSALDELPEADKAAELLPISVQQLFVACQLDKMEDAERLVEEITVSE